MTSSDIEDNLLGGTLAEGFSVMVTAQLAGIFLPIIIRK
jgi:hypothetical protein